MGGTLLLLVPACNPQLPESSDSTRHLRMGTRLTEVPMNSSNSYYQIIRWNLLAQAKCLSSPVLHWTWTPREKHECCKRVMLLPGCSQLWALPALLQPVHSPMCRVASGDHSPKPVLQAFPSQRASATICSLRVYRLCWAHW